MKVSAIVLSYNQEATIGRTLDHIVAQERDFDIEVIVGDDASRDGTRAVIEDYAARHPFIRLMPAAPNKGILRNYLDCLAECRGEYVAACAGDDFWHDPLKLQKQAAFLDANPDCGVLHGSMLLMDAQTGAVTAEKPRTPPDGWVGTAMFFGHIVQAPSLLFRRELVQYVEREQWLAHGFLMEDAPLMLEFSHRTQFKYLPEPFVTYSVGGNSASRGGALEKQLRFVESTRDVRYYFWDKFRPPFPRRRITRKYQRRVLRLVLAAGDRKLFWQKAREFGIGYSLAIALGEKMKGR